ncbi:MAG: hypothetical protein ACOYKF_11575, partial [Phenylobacterium sp.]
RGDGGPGQEFLFDEGVQEIRNSEGCADLHVLPTFQIGPPTGARARLQSLPQRRCHTLHGAALQ